MFKFHLRSDLSDRRIIFSGNKNLEPQEVLLDGLAKIAEEKFGFKERKFEVPLSQRSIAVFLISIFIIFAVLFFKTFQYQVLEYNNYFALAQKNKFIYNSVSSERGVIYDSLGNQLVFNKPSFDLIIDKKQLPKAEIDKENVYKEAAGIIGESVGYIKERIEKEKSNIVFVSEIVEQKKLILLETKISELTGFEIQKNAVRQYADGKSYAHLIGYTGKINQEELEKSNGEYTGFDYIGRYGIEKTYESYLRRNPGQVRVERDASGKEISKEIIAPSESGKSLVLYLDSDLQKEIERVLQKAIEDLGIKKAVGVAVNPKNGGVMALVSIPSFDNNLFITGADQTALSEVFKDKTQPLFNRVTQGQYPTGSTIKPMIATAALEEKTIPATKAINCEGKIVIPNRYNPEDIYEKFDWTTHGWTDMRKALAESCDVYFYTIGGGFGDQKGLGPTKIKKYLDLFGWGSPTGIDLPNENTGFIPTKEWKKEVKGESWYDGDTYNISIGQGDLKATPIQETMAIAAVANGGILYKPKVVKEIVDGEKNVIEEIKPEIIRQNFVDPKSLEIVRDGLRRAITAEDAPHASCKILNDLPVAVAAKTGTAQTSKKDIYDNWITVFAPYDDPQIVLTLMVEDVDRLAAIIPPAKEILNWYFMPNK